MAAHHHKMFAALHDFPTLADQVQFKCHHATVELRAGFPLVGHPKSGMQGVTYKNWTHKVTRLGQQGNSVDLELRAVL